MRKIYILITMVLAGFQAHSQGTQVGDANSPIYHYNGNVGIGTNGPSDKLEVIGALRIRNSNSTNSWTGITTLGLGASRAQSSGFILSYFEPHYDLKSLDQVEEFIAENGHLPDIPSAKEVEENGISLGEMDAKLLQKIEELTLYVIKLQKTVAQQAERINQLENINR